jgi:hypothetical protein
LKVTVSAMPDGRPDIQEAKRLIDLAKNTKDPKARAEILDLAEACLTGSGPVVQQQQQVQPRAKKSPL